MFKNAVASQGRSETTASAFFFPTANEDFRARFCVRSTVTVADQIRHYYLNKCVFAFASNGWCLVARDQKLLRTDRDGNAKVSTRIDWPTDGRCADD